MISRKFSGALRHLLYLLWLAGVPAVAADGWEFDDVARVVALSDVHGDFYAMASTLENAGLVNEARAWTGEDAHLVITGDVLDRGPYSRAALDLIMRLEGEAEAAGGAVHMLLGNHEVMNLVGDLRYVNVAEFAAFAADEDADVRAAWLERYKAIPSASDASADTEPFDERYPPGFFGHRQAFSAGGSYGQWLLKQPLVVVINGTAFVHGGLSRRAGELGLEAINGDMTTELRRYVRALGKLVDAGLLDPAANFHTHAARLEAIDVQELDEELEKAVTAIIDLADASIHAPDSPLWYRGNVACGPLIENDKLAFALDALGAERVVVGHTPTYNRNIIGRLDGKVIEIDTGMLKAYYGGQGRALILEDGELSTVSESATEEGAVGIDTHPWQVGRRPAPLSAEELADILREGDIVETAADASGARALQVHAGEIVVNASFVPASRTRGFSPELAAYRLDRFLQLGMVPVTVTREVDEAKGVLQFVPAETMNEAERRAEIDGNVAPCPLPEQWNSMYVFDALIHNTGRTQDRMLYDTDTWQLMLIGHDVAFQTNRSRPAYLKELPLAVGDYWQERLLALSGDVIDEIFRGTLDQRRRRALLARRNLLLQEAADDE